MARCQSWFISWCSIVYGYQNVSLESTTLVHGKACSSDMSGTGPLDIAENGLFDLTFVIMSGWCFGTCFKNFRILGISSSQLTFTPSFFRWVGRYTTRCVLAYTGLSWFGTDSINPLESPGSLSFLIDRFTFAMGLLRILPRRLDLRVDEFPSPLAKMVFFFIVKIVAFPP